MFTSLMTDALMSSLKAIWTMCVMVILGEGERRESFVIE
jgi:hypothetical protein